MRYNESIEARIAEVKAEKLRFQRVQASKIPKPLFRKNHRAKIRIEKMQRTSDIHHSHITPKPSSDLGGLPKPGEECQAAFSFRKRKHGKGFMGLATMDLTLICGNCRVIV